MPRAVAALVAVTLAVAFVAFPASAHVGFEFEGSQCDLVHHWWYYKGKEMYTHNAAYVFPGAPAGAQAQWILSMDDHGHDPEYGTRAPFEEDAHGRLKACQALAAIEADATAMNAARLAAIAANAAAQTFNFHGYAYRINCNANSWSPQVTFGVRLNSLWAMFRALHANNAINAGALHPNLYTPYIAADATWAGNAAIAALSPAQKGFVLLIAAMRLGGNDPNPYESPKQHMDFIMHTTWNRVRNELTAAERAALLVALPNGQHVATHYADLIVTSVIGTMNALPVGGIVMISLSTLPLHAQMYRGGWTLAGVNMSPTFNQWVHDVLNAGTDLLRHNPITYVVNRVGNMDQVDVLHGANHLIMEARVMAAVQTNAMAAHALKWYDFFARWNAAAAGVVVAGAALAAPARVMEVHTGVAVTAAAAPAYPSAGAGCAVTVQNTCQPHAAVNINNYFVAVAAAEAVRTGGACFLEHNSKAASVKLHRRKRLAKAKAKAKVLAEGHEHCAVPVAPTEPRTSPSPFANVAALEKAIADGQKQNPNEKLPKEILDALAYAKELEKKQKGGK